MARRPCRSALRLMRCFACPERGPVLFREFRRLAAILRSEVITPIYRCLLLRSDNRLFERRIYYFISRLP